ncbi:hypothetical protein [Falsiruegeria mediterranea]|uniref:hypothetical protein n=1 Tax=Falsiruegeria mediterranea TaxID=1280832 RepID=UPI0015F258A2|nr:hypothetical protein [Falsiruegeria mediterranea]
MTGNIHYLPSYELQPVTVRVTIVPPEPSPAAAFATLLAWVVFGGLAGLAAMSIILAG